MRKEKIIKVNIETCDICEISYEEHRKKHPKDWSSCACGFGNVFIDKLGGYISVCPTCLKAKDKDWEGFEEIIKRKIEIRTLIKGRGNN